MNTSELTFQIRKNGQPFNNLEIYGIAKAKKMVDELNKKHQDSKFTAHHIYKETDDLA